MIQQSKGERAASNKSQESLNLRQARNYEMPKRAPEPSSFYSDERKPANQYKRDRSGSNNARRPPIPVPEKPVDKVDRSQLYERDREYFNKASTEHYRETPSSSIIAEMHYQRGMKDVKQDLQRKIFSYQSILKKTYGNTETSQSDRTQTLRSDQAS